MNRIPVEPLSLAYRLLNPGSVVLVSAGDGMNDNLFPVTWNMPVRKDPPKVALLSGKRHYSYGLISRTGELSLNVPGSDLADAVLRCGTCSGHDDIRKFDQFGLTREKAERIRAPLVGEALASLECRVSQIVDMGPSSLIIADVLRAVASDKYFVKGDWVFGDGLELIHHLGGPRFAVSDRFVTASRADD